MKEPRTSMFFKKYSGVFLILVITVIAVLAFKRVASEITIEDVLSGLRSTHSSSIIFAFFMMVLCYVSLSGYDIVALRSLGKNVPRRDVFKGSVSAYALSHNIGFAPITGTYARYRMYSPYGVTLADVARIMVLAGASFWLGIILILGISLVVFPGVLRLGSWIPPYPFQVAVGLLITDIIVIYYLLIARGKKNVGFGKFSVPLPNLQDAFFQSFISLLEMILASGILWVLIPDSTIYDYPFVLVAYVFAFVMVLITHAPGGAGVLEAIILLMLPSLPGGQVVSALLLFRVIFHLIPLVFGIIILVRASKFDTSKHTSSRVAGSKNSEDERSFVS